MTKYQRKKGIALCLTGVLAFGLVACGSGKKASENAGNNVQQTETSNNDSQKYEGSNESLGEFNKNVTLEETVMVDDGGVKITATGLRYTSYEVELELTIENNTDKNLSFISGSVGYCCNSVNGYMNASGYLNCDVAAGKKANDSIGFGYDQLMMYGINEIADMEIGFDISDDDYNHTYTGPCQVKTSAYDGYDYGTEHYKQTITSPAAENTFAYELKSFSEDVIYEEGGVKVVSSGVIEDREGNTSLLLEVDNTTDQMVSMVISDIAINGVAVQSSTWSTDTVNPGKRAILDVDLSHVFEKDFWSIYGLEEVGCVSVSLSLRDEAGKDLGGKTFVDVNVPGANAAFDASGEEVYNKDGLRIVSKNIFENTEEYASYDYIFLLAENNSGKTIKITDVYESLSVNGFMVDYSFYGREIPDGQSAVLKIDLWKSSLEDNNINSADEITEIEFGIEIKEGQQEFDNTTLIINP